MTNLYTKIPGMSTRLYTSGMYAVRLSNSFTPKPIFSRPDNVTLNYSLKIRHMETP